MVWNWAICRDMKEPRKCHTEWSKSEREKQIHINTYMTNLEKWYRWSYLWSRNRDTDVENKYMDIKGEEGVGRTGDQDLIHIRLTLGIKWPARTDRAARGALPDVLWGPDGRKPNTEETHARLRLSFCHTAETNTHCKATILQKRINLKQKNFWQTTQ